MRITGLAAAIGAVALAAVVGTPVRADMTLKGEPKIAFVYFNNKDDGGWVQALDEARQKVEKALNTKIPFVEKVPEQASALRPAVERYIQRGYNIILGSAFGYSDTFKELAAQYPDVAFLNPAGTTNGPNLQSYYGRTYESQYLCGMTAGAMTKSGKLGFIAAKPIPQVLRNINAFALGARSVNPSATVQVIFTGDWSMPVKEAEAATSLINQGVDVLTCHVDSPKVILETAERRGIYVCGYHANGSKLAPKGYLTGAEWNWSKVYTDYAEMVKSGKTLAAGTIPHLVRGGLKEGFVKCSDYGPAVGDEAKKNADAAKAKFMDGSMVIFKGPLKDNTGKEILPAGKEYKQQDIELESMGWLVEGVIGGTKS